VCCSFCGKLPTDRRSIVRGPTPQVAICRECVALCNEIITEQHATTGSQPPPAAA
jgi:ATP-dependent protease Clp ATPase subunit